MIGRIVGRYEIKARLGESGVGVMYEALDLENETTAIIKFLPSDLINTSSAKAKFEDASEKALQLAHGNVCGALSIGVTDHGEPYIVTEFFPGGTLRRLLKDGKLEPSRAIDFAIQVCDGLGAGHRLGIVHRDLQPANLLVTRDDRVKILDFGFSGLDREASLTLTGAVIGSVAYLAPEQLEGAELDERTDVWAVGLLLVEMMTGSRTFERFSLPTTFEAILTAEAPKLESECPSAPAGVDGIIATCLAKNSTARFDDAVALATALREL